MYDVLDICRYIIKYSNDKDYGVSNLKLQKLLYFIQAFFLINSNGEKACFKELIKAWDIGPVVPAAYKEFAAYGSTDIPHSDYYINFDIKKPWDICKKKFDENCIKEEDKTLINLVVDKFADYSATDLVYISQRQTPWIDSYVRQKKKKISTSALVDFFVENN